MGIKIRQAWDVKFICVYAYLKYLLDPVPEPDATVG
jgi:hypothetical protein